MKAPEPEIQSISPYSVQMRENTDPKNSEYGHFSCSAYFLPTFVEKLFSIEPIM